MSARKHIKRLAFVTALATFTLGAVLRVSAATEFAILSPTTYSTVSGSEVTVTFSIPEIIKLTDYSTSSKSVYGQGHIHLWLDQTDLSKANAIEVTTEQYTLKNIKPGSHVLTAELVTNAHTSLMPIANSQIQFDTTQMKTSSPISPFSSLSFQMSLVALILISLSLYFIKTHIHKKSPKSKSKSKK